MKELHHANIIVEQNNSCNFVFDILKNQLDFLVQNNPDFLLLENLNFGIDEARNFGAWIINKPLVGEVKVAILLVKSITHEAQNALLKILEEPPIGTYIFIQVGSLGGILPTFLSRLRILNVPKEFSDTSGGSEFLKGDIKKKFLIIKTLARKVDKSEMQKLIGNLEENAYKTSSDNLDLKNILKAKVFANIRGSSPRILLEWLACVLK